MGSWRTLLSRRHVKTRNRFMLFKVKHNDSQQCCATSYLHRIVISIAFSTRLEVFQLFASKYWIWFEICDHDWSLKPFNFCSNNIHILLIDPLKDLRIGRFQPFDAGVNTPVVCGSLLSLTKGITKRKDYWNRGVWLSMDHLCHMKIF